MRKSVLRTFGVAMMAALGLMAVSAAGAQAAGELFLVLGSSALAAVAEFTGEQLGAGKLLIPTKGAYVECKKADVQEAKAKSDTTILGKIRFLECKTFKISDSKELTACPIEGEPTKETIDSLGILLFKEHASEKYILIEEDESKPLAEIKFGALCGIGVKVKITGTVAGLVHEGAIPSVTKLVLFSQAIQELMGDELKYGAAASYIDADVDVKLTGAHAGCTWAID